MIFLILMSALVYPLRINGDHLYDVGLVVDKQLENLEIGNAKTIVENIEHYNKLMEARIENVKSQDPRLLPAPREFVAKGRPQFVKSVDLPKIEEKYEWDSEESKSFMDLVEQTRNMWLELESELSKIEHIVTNPNLQ